MLKRLLITGLFTSFCIVTWAQETDTLYRNIDEVVVTGTRAGVNRSNVPMTISVVGRDEIEASSESALLPVLSERVPGLFVTQRGVTGFGVAAGGSGGITMRGIGGSPNTQTLVLIDGHPQFMGLMGHHLPDAYVASDVEKVEVIRGPASILYGSNAMGGVLNIITRKQDQDGWSANGRVMYGAYNTPKYMANAGLRKGKFNGFLSLNHDRTDGHRDNSNFNITNGYTKLGYQLSDHFRVWGDVSLAVYEAENPGTTSKPMFENVADILRGVASVSLENNYAGSNGAFTFFYNFGDHKINDGYAQNGTPKNYHYRSRDNNYGVMLYQIFRPFQGNMLTTGFDFKSYGGHAWNDFMDDKPDADIADKEVNEVAGYLIMQQTLFEKLTLNGGLRLEHNSEYGFEWIPQIGLAYRPLQHTVVKASVAKGFRSPTIRELYMFMPANADLQPERMINYEISVGQSFWNGRLSAELTGFIADGSNMIKTEMVGGKPINMNTGDFKNTGVELAVKWNVLTNLHIQGNYSYLHMKTPVVYAPGQQAYLAVSYRIKRWSMNVGYQYIHELYTDANTISEDDTAIENYGQLNAKVAYRPLKWLDIFVKGENLTDKKYEIMHEYPMPGFTVFGGVNISFK